MTKLPDDVAIRVENVHKDFHLPHNNEDSIKHKIITAFEKKDKEIDTLHALRGISFDIKKGEFFGILGRNGSGKSTLLKIISDIYRPTKGSVQHKGSLVAFIELGVGFNPQLTGRENVYLNAALLGFSRDEIDGFYDEVVDFAELHDHMEQKLKNYSSGMRVRLAFSVAIRANADILILDEVLAVGDIDFQRKCYEYFDSLKEQSKTIVFVTHSMGAVRQYCDRAILIENGKIKHQGDAEDIATEYLKLFNKPLYEKEQEEKARKEAENRTRWGSGQLTLENIITTVTQKTVKVKMKIQNNTSAVKDVVVAVDIFDAKKRLVGGTESFRISDKKLDFSAKEAKDITFEFENIFGGGKYLIYTSVKRKNNAVIYDFIKEADTFTNTEETEEYFPIVLPAKLDVA